MECFTMDIKKYVSMVIRTTHRIPWDHRCLFSRISILTSGVPIIFSANLRISLIARGALFLNPLSKKSKYSLKTLKFFYLWWWRTLYIVYTTTNVQLLGIFCSLAFWICINCNSLRQSRFLWGIYLRSFLLIKSF